MSATLVYGIKLSFDAVEQYGVEQYHVKKRKKKEKARLMGQSAKRKRVHGGGGGGDSDNDTVGYRDDDEHDDYRGDNHDHTENFWESTSDTSDTECHDEDSEIDPKVAFKLTRWTFADVEKAFKRQVKGLTLLYCAPFSDCSMAQCVFFAVPLRQPKTLEALRLEEASEGWGQAIEAFELGAATKPWFHAALEGE